MTDLVGAGSLVRLVLRRDRVRLPVWVVAILGLVYASGGAVQDVYGSPAAIEGYRRTVGSSPASIALSGPPTALDSIAGITIFEINTTAVIAVALMSIFLVVRHTRAEEEAGRTELLRAGVLGRYAPIAAPLLVVSAASCVVGAGIGMLLVGLGLPAAGSVGYGASIAAIGVVFTAVTLVAAQLTTHARGALGLAGLVLGAAFVLRAVGDVTDNGLSWVSPIGWSQAVHPYAGDRWWPLAISGAAVAGLLATCRALAARRDLGAGLLAPRAGPPVATAWLAGPIALAARLQRGSVVGWTAGIALTGLTLGSFGGEVRELVESNPDIAEFLGDVSEAGLVDAFLATALFILALLASGFAVASTLRLRSEEEAGRAEAVLSTAASRVRWLTGHVTVTVAAVVLALLAGGVGVGVARATDTGEVGEIARLTAAALAYLPAVLVLAGLAVLVWGWWPRLALVAWAALAVAFVVGYLGDLLDLPSWVLDVSPFTHVPDVPAAPLAVTPLVILSVVALAAASLGVAGFVRRDVTT